MTGIAATSTEVSKGHFKVCGKEFPRVSWLKLSNLRNTYFILFFVILTSVSYSTSAMIFNGTDQLLGH